MAKKLRKVDRIGARDKPGQKASTVLKKVQVIGPEASVDPNILLGIQGNPSTRDIAMQRYRNVGAATGGVFEPAGIKSQVDDLVASFTQEEKYLYNHLVKEMKAMENAFNSWDLGDIFSDEQLAKIGGRKTAAVDMFRRKGQAFQEFAAYLQNSPEGFKRERAAQIVQYLKQRGLSRHFAAEAVKTGSDAVNRFLEQYTKKQGDIEKLVRKTPLLVSDDQRKGLGWISRNMMQETGEGFEALSSLWQKDIESPSRTTTSVEYPTAQRSGEIGKPPAGWEEKVRTAANKKLIDQPTVVPKRVTVEQQAARVAGEELESLLQQPIMKELEGYTPGVRAVTYPGRTMRAPKPPMPAALQLLLGQQPLPMRETPLQLVAGEWPYPGGGLVEGGPQLRMQRQEVPGQSVPPSVTAAGMVRGGVGPLGQAPVPPAGALPADVIMRAGGGRAPIPRQPALPGVIPPGLPLYPEPPIAVGAGNIPPRPALPAPGETTPRQFPAGMVGGGRVVPKRPFFPVGTGGVIGQIPDVVGEARAVEDTLDMLAEKGETPAPKGNEKTLQNRVRQLLGKEVEGYTPHKLEGQALAEWETIRRGASAGKTDVRKLAKLIEPGLRDAGYGQKAAASMAREMAQEVLQVGQETNPNLIKESVAAARAEEPWALRKLRGGQTPETLTKGAVSEEVGTALRRGAVKGGSKGLKFARKALGFGPLGTAAFLGMSAYGIGKESRQLNKQIRAVDMMPDPSMDMELLRLRENENLAARAARLEAMSPGAFQALKMASTAPTGLARGEIQIGGSSTINPGEEQMALYQALANL